MRDDEQPQDARWRVECRVAITLAVLTFAATQQGCIVVRQGPTHSDDFHGQVVDAETSEPIRGAVVTVVWKKFATPDFAVRNEVHSVRETLTDAEGRYRVKSAAAFNWDPLKDIEPEPRVVIYRAGYGPFPDAHVEPSLPRETWKFYWQPLLDGATVTLQKGRGDLHRLARLSILVGDEVEAHDVPLLSAEIQRQLELHAGARQHRGVHHGVNGRQHR